MNPFEKCNIPKFTIIYATQTGTAEELSEKLSEHCKKHNLSFDLINIEEISSIDFFNKNKLLIFFCSTFGDGEPSSDAIDFTNMVEDENFWKDLNNPEIRYAMFGLGSKDYPKFNEQAKRLDKIFSKHMKFLTPLMLGDDSKDIRADCENWIQNILFPAMANYYKKTNEISNENLKDIPKFKIIYATQTDTAKELAEKLSNECKKLNLNFDLINIEEVDSIDFFNNNKLIIFLCSTFGDGEPTTDAIYFTNMIENENFWKDFNNPEIRYAIFGLGHRNYPKFNAQAKRMERIFSDFMISLCPLTLGDDAKDIRADCDNWIKNIILPSILNYKNIVNQTKNIIKKPYKLKLSKEKSNQIINNEAYISEVNDYLNAKTIQIEKIEELRQNNKNGSTLKVTFSLKNSDANYQTGANITIYPKNSEEDVNFIINHLKYNENDYITYTDGFNNLPLPQNITIKEAFTNFIDVSAKLPRQFFKKISKFATNPSECEAMIQKSNEFHCGNYSFIDILKEYPSISIDFNSLLKLLSNISGRAYTCCSSKLKNKESFSLAISLVTFENFKSEVKFGLTSKYFKNLYEKKKLDSMKIIFKEPTFNLPNDLSIPMLLISTGTGIAPSIAFLEELNELKKGNYEIYLIYGAKNKESDFIFKNELEEFKKNGILKELFTAFSRDQKEKIYVQNVLEKNFKKDVLVDLCLNKKMRIYICGSVSMGNSINEKLEEILGKENYENIKKNKQLFCEFWGN